MCGLLASPITAAGGLGLSVAALHGVDLLYEILRRYGRLDEEHLKAAVLHCMLDCADQRMMRWDGSYLWRKYPLEMLRPCRGRVVERWKELYHRYFLFGYSTLKRIEELAGLAEALLRNELERCLLDCVVPEAEGKGAPKVGPRAVAELLNCVRERMGRKAVCCVNWQMLPQASAATKIYAELSKRPRGGGGLRRRLQLRTTLRRDENPGRTRRKTPASLQTAILMAVYAMQKAS